MDVHHYKEIYKDKTTDDLLYLYIRGNLEESAHIALESTLKYRKVSEEDIKHAEQFYISERIQFQGDTRPASVKFINWLASGFFMILLTALLKYILEK